MGAEIIANSGMLLHMFWLSGRPVGDCLQLSFFAHLYCWSFLCRELPSAENWAEESLESEIAVGVDGIHRAGKAYALSLSSMRRNNNHVLPDRLRHFTLARVEERPQFSSHGSPNSHKVIELVFVLCDCMI